jgi:hypothetical protein
VFKIFAVTSLHGTGPRQFILVYLTICSHLSYIGERQMEGTLLSNDVEIIVCGIHGNCPDIDFGGLPSILNNTATRYGAGRQRDRSSSPGGLKIFSSPRRPTQPPLQWVPEALSPGIKRQRREADHSPQSRAEIKKTWIYTSTPPYAFMA